MPNSLVSIILPVYNSAEFLEMSVSSVICQSYKNWELIIVDDCSSDSSPDIIKRYIQLDSRICYLKTSEWSGSPMIPRNMGIKESKGRYICFLDSDDFWLPDKLQHQIDCFVTNPDVFLVYSNFEKIKADGKRNGRVLKMPDRVNYTELLEGNVIGCSTAVYDTEKLGKCYFPSCGHEDYELWLSMLRHGGYAYNTGNVDALYRVRRGSVSANKLWAAHWQWVIYRRYEHLSLHDTLFYFCKYAYNAIRKSLI